MGVTLEGRGPVWGVTLEGRGVGPAEGAIPSMGWNGIVGGREGSRLPPGPMGEMGPVRGEQDNPQCTST